MLTGIIFAVTYAIPWNELLPYHFEQPSGAGVECCNVIVIFIVEHGAVSVSLPTMLPRSTNGIPYLPDGNAFGATVPPPGWWRQALLFAVVFVALQALWAAARGTALERLWIDTATVRPAAALVNVLTPGAEAVALGTRIRAAGGGLNILNGCEGTEIVFLLIAAFAAVRLPWRHRLGGLALGLGIVFVLNQARILALFYAFRADRDLFDALHTGILPVVLVVLTAAYFYAILHHGQRRLA